MAEIDIIPSDEFRRQAKRLAKKYRSLANDLARFQQELQDNPFIGVDLGDGKRKFVCKSHQKERVKVEECVSLPSMS